MRGLLSFAALMTVGLSVPLSAQETLTIDLPEPHEITSPPPTIYRYLVPVSLPVELQGATVEFATLELYLESDVSDSLPLAVEAFAISTPWDPDNTTWDVPWEVPGGDFYTTHMSHFAFAVEEEAHIKTDVTTMIRAWAEEDLSQYGIILRCGEARVYDFEILEFPDDAEVWGRLEIHYTPAI